MQYNKLKACFRKFNVHSGLYNKILIFHILFFLFFVWGGWHSGITLFTQNWKVLSSNLTYALCRDELWDPTSLWSSRQPSCWTCRVCCTNNLLSPIFFCISKILSNYIRGQWGKNAVKNNATLCFHIYFLDIFILFFIILISFFQGSI